MASLLIVDDARALTELFAEAIRSSGGHDVRIASRIADVPGMVADHPGLDLALVDLSFPQERGSGLDALAAIHTMSPATALAIVTQGDEWVAQLLRDAWELLPIATVISKSAPLAFQLDAIEEVLRTGSSPVDPAIRPLVPAVKPALRTVARFALLVPHAGHAKLWAALLDAAPGTTYKQIADATGLRLNTVKNYRASLLGELMLHGLDEPGLEEMREFAVRCRPFLVPHVTTALERAR
ncbi:response regulator transcription factor [Desertimonas flava]|uniref:response regulator transcription factor n=1 Tax=Desertimonas flava TaxID=2064846 RepID=UPI000E34996A|nr:response regulator transcription factor [Desertimonas flava]